MKLFLFSIGFFFFLNNLYVGTGLAVTFTDSSQSLGKQPINVEIEIGDIDNDGDLDFIEPNDGGGNPTEPRVRIFMNNGLGTFSDSGQNLGESSAKDADLGDIDNDGTSDMIIATWLVENSLLINDGNGNFTQVGPDVLLPLGTHACKLGDLDNDGDLDLVAGGLIDEIYTVYYSNQASVVKNAPPSPPTKFQVEDDNGKLVLKWDGAADTETKLNALTYNLRIGKANNLNAIVTGIIHHGPGNMGHAQEKTLSSLKEGDYIWSVQTVDTGHARSDWSEEQSLTINTPVLPNVGNPSSTSSNGGGCFLSTMNN